MTTQDLIDRLDVRIAEMKAAHRRHEARMEAINAEQTARNTALLARLDLELDALQARQTK
jgi:hypothetical protein